MELPDLKQLVGGDRQAFRRYLEVVVGYLAGYPMVKEDRDDIAIEVVTRAALHADRFLGKSSVGTWVIGIARHVLLEHYRRVRARPTTVDIGHLSEDVEDERALEAVQFLGDAAEEALAMLPGDQRQAITLCKVMGMTAQEAATAMGKTPNAVLLLVSRGRIAFGRYYREIKSALA